jgi:hypothetical protein
MSIPILRVCGLIAGPGFELSAAWAKSGFGLVNMPNVRGFSVAAFYCVRGLAMEPSLLVRVPVTGASPRTGVRVATARKPKDLCWKMEDTP